MAALRTTQRSGSIRMPIKEKFVQIYEAFFRGDNPAVGNPNFWDELFLLKVNHSYIEQEFAKLNGDQLLQLKGTFNEHFSKCVEYLDAESPIRTVSSIQILCSFIRGIFSKAPSSGFDIINVLIGFDEAEQVMKHFVDRANIILQDTNVPLSLKAQVLHLLLVLVTGTENVNQNVLLEYIMGNSVFESITFILADPVLRLELGHDTVLLLTILLQYRKYESANPYIVKLSILDDELALHGYAQVISAILSKFNRDFAVKHTEQQAGGILSTLTSMVGSVFVTEDKAVAVDTPGNDSILLTMYEAIHLNRNFNSTLTQSHNPSSPAVFLGGKNPPLSPIAPPTVSTTTPTNLLVTFIEYSSIILQELKEPSRRLTARLCLIIFTCVSEDQYANSLMHDGNMTFRVHLHRAPMRHRKAPLKDKFCHPQPLACAVLDLMVEFVRSHMMKNLPVEQYTRSLGVIHRLLCYQKRCRVRLQYPWKELWTALINLLKFVTNNEPQMLPSSADICQLSQQVINILNLFINHGDTFLPNHNSYDDLYYEMIRTHQTLDNLYTMGLRISSTEGQFKDAAIRLTNSLGNLRAIIKHFIPRIDKWAAANSLSALSEEQVLDVIRSNYESLTLKLLDNLDQYDRYAEKPQEIQFISRLVRQIILDVRHSISMEEILQPPNLHEFSTIE